ncbi:MAG: CusA/CzcA family heavy metal efflux RND transporter [Gemmataceae bacterium]|nr:CusA/CzcA family heavy metal efflux RND transporter [Gemmataceae bacterium]MCI0740089.1 CusA/CzcA family heavy metal efflux RND transporter [Gemmataceae bacterium]
MLNWIIDVSLRNRLLVVLLALAAAAVGVFSLRQLDIDAFPDTTPVQVQINTVAPALGPKEIEQQITFPIEQVLSGLPRLELLRSVSKFGLSQVVVTFEDGTDIYFARQLVNERLTTAELPADIERPKMGPVATGLGEVFHYVVSGQGTDLTDMRTIHDWVIKPKMRTVKGAAEINSWGGFEKQFQIRLDPNKLDRHKLTFDEVIEAVKKNNRNVGGGNIRHRNQMLLVTGIGRVENVEEIKGIVITSQDGVPIKIEDVADVEIGHEIRRGAVTANGQGEVVLGLGFMLMGENSHKVTWAMKQKLDEIKAGLPANVKVQPVYDRTELVDFVIHTVRNNLFEAGLLVVAVLFLFLGNLRAATIVALAIPLSMLFAFSGMLRFGIAASLLSLGAIDFGMIVDSSVVMVENCVRHIAHGDLKEKTKLAMIRDAAVEVRKPTMFGELIIMIVYLPILTLEGIEGKLFRPMALTVICALAGSMILSMTLMPVLASYFLPKKIEEREPLFMRLALAVYNPILKFSMAHKSLVIAIAVGVLIFAFGFVAPQLGSEFVPTLSEGAIAINVVRLADTPIERSIEENTKIEQIILQAFPEVNHIWSRIGTAEIATDPMGVELTDIFLSLKPRSEWAKARQERIERLQKKVDNDRTLIERLKARTTSTQSELTDLIQKEVRPFLGPRFGFTQPIKLRLDEMISGVRADLGVKLFGDDIKTLQKKAVEIDKVLKSIEGNADVAIEPLTGLPLLQIKVKQGELARHGVPASEVMDLVEALGGTRISEVVEGEFRFPLVIRLPETYRATAHLGPRGREGEIGEAKKLIEELPIVTAKGERLPLARLAEISVLEDTPSTITREWGQRRITVTCNVRGRDLGSFVAEAERKLKDEVQMPSSRYHMQLGGQWEHLISARNRLLIVVPVALLLICGLLYLTYGNFVDMARVFTGVPFGAVGGIIALWIRDMPFSISAAIGFIAMSGVAVLDDMILVSYIRQLRRKGLPLDEAVRQAAQTRLRPVLMTTLVASLGFVPMAFSTGMGAEVQRPLATVVIGGVISAMVMSLFVVRILYVIFKSPLDKDEKEAPAAPDARTASGTGSD